MMKHIGIPETCSEDRNAMTPTERGLYCKKCTKEVYDFTNKSKEEIKAILRAKLGQSVCATMHSKQQDELNQEFLDWQSSSRKTMQRAMVYSLVVVFGLTLFSCTTQNEKEMIQRIQTTVQSLHNIDSNELEQLEEPIESVDQSPLMSEMIMGQMQVSDIKEYAIYDTIKYDYSDIALGGAIVTHVEYEEFLVKEADLSYIDKAVEYDKNGILIPDHFDAKVFPNPMTTEGKFELLVPVEGVTVVGLYDMKGNHLRNLHEGNIERGTHHFPLELADKPSGSYIIIVRSKEYSSSTKFIKL